MKELPKSDDSWLVINKLFSLGLRRRQAWCQRVWNFPMSPVAATSQEEAGEQLFVSFPSTLIVLLPFTLFSQESEHPGGSEERLVYVVCGVENPRKIVS